METASKDEKGWLRMSEIFCRPREGWTILAPPYQDSRLRTDAQITFCGIHFKVRSFHPVRLAEYEIGC
jgi:hypothetical protein